MKPCVFIPTFATLNLSDNKRLSILFVVIYQFSTLKLPTTIVGTEKGRFKTPISKENPNSCNEYHIC
jgi:hypothetical protein